MAEEEIGVARIRSIKPEFWSSEQVMSCSFHSRLFSLVYGPSVMTAAFIR